MRLTKALAIIAAASFLTGCAGGDDVEIVLPFVGDVAAKAKRTEEKMATRGPIVLPPKIADLPEPDSAKAPSTQDWPDDPDMKAKSEAEIAKAKDAEYRKHGDWSGARNTGNGLEDFQKKVDWSARQRGIFQDTIEENLKDKPDKE